MLTEQGLVILPTNGALLNTKREICANKSNDRLKWHAR